MINFKRIAHGVGIPESANMNNTILDYSLKRMMSGFCSTAAIACFLLGASDAFAQTSYAVTDLGVLPNKEESVPAAINGQGQVAGTSSASATGSAAAHAFFAYPH